MEPGGERELRRRHLPELRHQAAEYYRSNEVPQRLEEALNATFYLRPPDLYGHLADAPTATTVVQTSATHHKNEDKGSLANYFSKFSKPPVICKLIGRKVLDGVGRPTLEVEIFCTVKNHEKSICSTVVSSHSEILENASPEAIDADENERNDSINRALEWVNGSLNEMLRDLQPADQCKADELLGEYFAKKVEEEKERKAIEKEEQEAAISAPAYVPALSAVTPSGKKKGVKLGKKSSVAEKPISPAEPIEPVLCGSIAIAGLSLAVAKTGATINNTPLYLHLALMKHDLDLPKELTMPLPMVTLLSCGKSSSGKLKLMKEVMLIPPAELTVKQGIERLLEIQKQMMRLLDPVSKGDGQQWSNICNAVGSRCYLIAEDAAKSISKLVEDQNINVPKCSGLIIKYTNQTKISDLTELTRLLDGQRHIAILGSPAGESSDDSLVDLAVGLGARFIKLGGLSRGERVTKYNRLLAIEEELAKNGTLRSGENHEFVDFAEEALTVEELLDALPTIEQDPWPSEHSQPLLAQDQNPVSLHGSTLHLNEATNLDPSILP
ncbi:enolase 4 isoform X11 [Mauremys reevesii]|uniref:enolase 4 isoform X11 n=1 Tax=Mauremys reevesii TaxID=260615 RepID=UPI00193FD8D2|nr:enolase 4 isoform X11 [Mauremys reevesii]